MSSAVSIDPDGSVATSATSATTATAVAVQPVGELQPALAYAPTAHPGAMRARPRVMRPPWWTEALVIVWLCWVYDAITNLAPLRLHAALSHAEGVFGVERSLGIDPELGLDRWLAAHHTLGLLVSDYYDNAHFIVTLGLLGWLWWRRADLYRPLRNVLVTVNVIAFAIFWLYPVAPPRMLTHDGFSDIVASSHAFGSWHTGALASAANQLAAMPSLHMAWAAWCTIVVWRLSTRVWLRGLALLYPCMTAFAVLATGNHYVLDVLAGLVALAVAALVEAIILRKIRPPSVTHVTNLLRSLITGRLNRSPQTVQKR